MSAVNLQATKPVLGSPHAQAFFWVTTLTGTNMKKFRLVSSAAEEFVTMREKVR
jgi:hypothetical protein